MVRALTSISNPLPHRMRVSNRTRNLIPAHPLPSTYPHTPRLSHITKMSAPAVPTNGAGDARDPSGFLSEIIGAPVTVKLNSGVVYRGRTNPFFLYHESVQVFSGD